MDEPWVIVEHIDDGTLTLHVQGCQHAARATLTHEPNSMWLAGLDKVCGTCKPHYTGTLR
jgi:hypothetical protein